MKEVKACGAQNLPSTHWHRNSACTVNAWLRQTKMIKKPGS